MPKNVREILYILLLVIYSVLVGVTVHAVDGEPNVASEAEEIEISDVGTTVEGISGLAIYDPTSRTLTLDNFIYRGKGLYADVGAELSIRLIGDSVIESTSGRGLFATGALSVTAEDGATLNITMADGLGEADSSVALHANGAIKLFSGRIIVEGGDCGRSIGISSYSDITVEGAEVCAYGGDGHYLSAGVYVSASQPGSPIGADASIRINGGSLTAMSGTADISVGAYTEGEISITGGEAVFCGYSAVDAYSFDISDYFMPQVLIGDNAESATMWCGEDLSNYRYVSVSRAESIEIQPSELGDIGVSNIYAEPGERVELTVNPNAGYRVAEIALTDALGGNVALTDGGFVMPEYRVCVSVSFEMIAAASPVISFNDTSLSVMYGYSYGEAGVSVDVSFSDGVSEDEYAISYLWYDVTDGTAREVHGAASPEFYLPGGAQVGTYSYVCTIRAERRDNGLYSTASSDTVTFSVIKRSIDIPEPDTREFLYNGSVQKYAVESSEYYTVENDERLGAGEQMVIISLHDKERYCWSDGSSADIEYPFVINRAVASITLSVSEIVITHGDDFSLPSATANIGVVHRDKDEEDIVNIGKYIVTYTVLQTNNYTGDTKTLTVIVNPAEDINDDDITNDSKEEEAPPLDKDENEEDTPDTDSTDTPDTAPGEEGFDGEDDDFSEENSGSATGSEWSNMGVLIIVGAVLFAGAVLAVVILIIVKKRRDSMWVEYSRGNDKKKR